MKKNQEYCMHFFQNRYNRARKRWKRPGKFLTYGKNGVCSKTYLTLKNIWGERENSHEHLGKRINVSPNTNTAGKRVQG